MTHANIMQLGFFTAFFSLVFAAIGVYAAARLLGAFFVKKMHENHECPVCKTPMMDMEDVKGNVAEAFSPKPIDNSSQETAADDADIDEETDIRFKANQLLFSMKQEQFEALFKSGILSQEQLITVGELIRYMREITEREAA